MRLLGRNNIKQLRVASGILQREGAVWGSVNPAYYVHKVQGSISIDLSTK